MEDNSLWEEYKKESGWAIDRFLPQSILLDKVYPDFIVWLNNRNTEK